MLFELSRAKSDLNGVCINDEIVEKVKTQKFLGVLFDDKLSWKEHINSIISKLNSCLGATRRARPFLNKTSLLSIYHSLMQSHINYCIETWGSWQPRGNQVILRRLQAVVNKFFRLTYYLAHTDSVRHILKEHNVLNIYQNYDFHVSLLMHKAVNHNLPVPVANSLTTSNPFFFFKNPRLKQTEKSLSFAGPKIWNLLPNDLVSESEFNTFKNGLKLHILNK